MHEGDRVLAVNGRPLRSFDTLLQQTNASRPGDPMTLLIERKNGSRSTIRFPLSPQITGGKLALSFKLFILTLQAVFPGFCLLIGLWVVAAKPRDPNAWYVLGIFGFIQCFFGNANYWNGPILPFMAIYLTWPSLRSSSACCSSASTSRSRCVSIVDIPGPSGFSLRHRWRLRHWM